jgi:hypothetical protein
LVAVESVLPKIAVADVDEVVEKNSAKQLFLNRTATRVIADPF